MKDSSDIVLDFPFKDCVLNGGQSTEEGEEIYFKRNNDQSDSQLYKKEKRKRQEIFFNQTLAFDEIDRLLTQKHSQNSLATPQMANNPLAKSNAILTARQPKILLSKAII